MKASSFALITALTLGFITAGTAEAAKGNKNEAGRGGNRQAARMLAHFDANHDGTIETNEAGRLRTAFDSLKALDKDNDGKLSDEEIASIKVPQTKAGKAGKGKKAGKKGRGKNKA